MVNDVTSPVAASRYYAYTTMSSYEVVVALRPDQFHTIGKINRSLINMHDNYKSGKCKQQLRRDLGELQRGGLLSSVETAPEAYVSAEGVELVRPACLVEEPEQVKEALGDNFSKWFGKGRRKWFIDKQIWKKCEGATLRK